MLNSLIVILLGLSVESSNIDDSTWPLLQLSTIGTEELNLAPILEVRGSQVTGILVEQLACAAKQAGIKTSITPYPWPRAIQLLESGEIDGHFPVTLARLDNPHHYITIPFLEAQYALLHNTGIDPTDIQHVAILRGASFAKQLAEQRDLSVIEINSFKQMFFLLQKGRIDGVIANLIAADMYEQNQPSLKFERVMLGSATMYIAIYESYRWEHPDNIRIFSKAIQACANSPYSVNHLGEGLSDHR